MNDAERLLAVPIKLAEAINDRFGDKEGKPNAIFEAALVLLLGRLHRGTHLEQHRAPVRAGDYIDEGVPVTSITFQDGSTVEYACGFALEKPDVKAN